MNVQDEQDLRNSLTGLLEGVTPHAAPVASAVRLGKGIRMRRWIFAAAAVALVAAGAAAAPVLIQAHRAGPANGAHHKPRHYKVTVQPVGVHAAKHGVFAQGVTDGRPWKMVFSASFGGQVNVTGGLPGLGFESGPGPAGGLVSLESQSSNDAKGFTELVGAVSPRVASFTVSLPNGDVLALTPTRIHKQRLIGLILPGGVPIVRAVAYSLQGRELAYSVPFGETGLDVWWAPGQAGPAPMIKTIGSGIVDGRPWKITADFGPWGYCYAWANGSDCTDQTSNPELQRLPQGQLTAGISCGEVNNAGSAIIGTQAAARDVAAVVLKYSDGSSASFRTVRVLGGRSVGYAIPEHLTVVRAVEYGLSGKVVGSTNGATWNCWR